MHNNLKIKYQSKEWYGNNQIYIFLISNKIRDILQEAIIYSGFVLSLLEYHMICKVSIPFSIVPNKALAKITASSISCNVVNTRAKDPAKFNKDVVRESFEASLLYLTVRFIF